MSAERERACIALEESLQCFRDLNDEWGVALTIAYKGAALAVNPGTEAEARPLLLECRVRFGALGDEWGGSVASYYLGSIALRKGDYAAARELTEEVLGCARDFNDSYRISRGLYTLADIAFSERKYDEAIEHLKDSLALMREQGDSAMELKYCASWHEWSMCGSMRTAPVRLFAAAHLLASKDRTLPHDDPALNGNAVKVRVSRWGNVGLKSSGPKAWQCLSIKRLPGSSRASFILRTLYTHDLVANKLMQTCEPRWIVLQQIRRIEAF